MPLVRISVKHLDEPRRALIGDCVHRALVETFNVPRDDRFQIISEERASLIYDPSYLGIMRTDGIVIIQITLNVGRTVEMKRALYKRIVDLLQIDAGVRPEDVLIGLVEVPKENWSFGNGVAQYAEA